jgi:hypothetical protein
MELPYDVLQLIRAYAKPWFTHYKVYNRTLALMEQNSIPELRYGLLHHPERILPILTELENAHAEWRVANNAYAQDCTLRKRNLCESKRKVLRESEQLDHMKRFMFYAVQLKLGVILAQ